MAYLIKNDKNQYLQENGVYGSKETAKRFSYQRQAIKHASTFDEIVSIGDLRGKVPRKQRPRKQWRSLRIEAHLYERVYAFLQTLKNPPA